MSEEITAKEMANDIISWLEERISETNIQIYLCVVGSPFYVNKSIRLSVYKQVLNYIKSRDYLK